MPTQKVLAFSGVLATALVVAVVEAVGGGIGDRLVGLFDDDPPLVTSSDSQKIFGCGTQLFVPAPGAARVRSSRTPSEADWTAFARGNDALVAGQSAVEVSIQGETARTITLTGIEFEVERRDRPRGAVFSNPCGGPLVGRSLVVDLDRRPAAVVDSSEDPEGVAGAKDEAGRSVYRPIRFPWTVDVRDPLLLLVVGHTKRCDCTWRAHVTWRSGGESGRLAIDNDGAGYRVVGLAGAPYYLNGGSEQGWRRFRRTSG